MSIDTISQADLLRLFTKIGDALPSPHEITICGGASIILSHNFRDSTADVDCLYCDDTVMQYANSLRDKGEISKCWLNTDVNITPSYSEELFNWRALYNHFGNLTVYLINGPALLCMKLKSFRPNSNDYNDCVELIEYCLNHGYTCDDIKSIYTEIYSADASMDIDAERLLMAKGNEAIYSLDAESVQSFVDMLNNYVISPSEIPALFRRDIIFAYRKSDSYVDNIQKVLETLGCNLTYFDIAEYLPKNISNVDMKPFVVQAIKIYRTATK